MIQAPAKLGAWNPDYAVPLPAERTMCAERDTEDTVRFFAIFPEEECPEGSSRYRVVFAEEPRGAIALLRMLPAADFYPPLTLTWPPEDLFVKPDLWHFTCISRIQREVFGIPIDLLQYHGEMTANADLDCNQIAQEALRFCKESYGGDSLLEECSLSW